MIPFGNETVTLIQRIENVALGKTVVTYKAVILTGCSWMRRTQAGMDNNAMIRAEYIKCRVPAGQTKPKPGDLMIAGEADVIVHSGADYQRLIEQYRDAEGAFVVESVSDNARPEMPMPHYAAYSGMRNYRR